MDPLILVDDEKDLLDALGFMLRKEFSTIPIKSTHEPVEALRWISAMRPGLLITDVRMPDISGLELVDATLNRWKNVPIIITTAFASVEVDEVLRRGTLHYLPKPFRNQELIDLIHSILDTPSASERFLGTLAVSLLADVIQFHALSHSTGVLRVWGNEGEAEVHFENGDIVHALANGIQGRDGFNVLLAWPGGSFRFERETPAARTIFVPAHELLLDALRLRDEGDMMVLVDQPLTEDASLSLDEGLGEPLFSELEIVPVEPEPSAPPQTPQTPTPDPSEGLAAPAPSSASDDGEADRQPPPEGAVTRRVPGEPSMNNIQATLEGLANIDGFVGACVVSVDSGMVLGKVGGGSLNMDVAAAANAEVVKAKRKAIQALKLREEIEDILITLEKQYHLIRPSKQRGKIFIYLALDRQRANLALARMTLEDVEAELNFGR